MKRVIVDYSKLTNEILNLLVEKFPDGYDEKDIIRFKNTKNETIEAVEVRTSDTIFLVKVSTKLADRIENYDEEELIVAVPETVALKELDIDDEEEETEEETEKIDLDDDEDNDNEPSDDTYYDEEDEEDNN